MREAENRMDAFVALFYVPYDGRLFMLFMNACNPKSTLLYIITSNQIGSIDPFRVHVPCVPTKIEKCLTPL